MQPTGCGTLDAMSGGDMIWLPWIALLAVLALAGAWWAGRRGDAPAAVRRVGYALGVLGLWALGIPSLLYRLWAALSGWAARLLLNPLSWVGVVATVAAVILVLAGIAWGSRREPRRAVTGGGEKQRKQREPGALEPQSTRDLQTSTQSSSESSADAEIDAILRRHGIS